MLSTKGFLIFEKQILNVLHNMSFFGILISFIAVNMIMPRWNVFLVVVLDQVVDKLEEKFLKWKIFESWFRFNIKSAKILEDVVKNKLEIEMQTLGFNSNKIIKPYNIYYWYISFLLFLSRLPLFLLLFLCTTPLYFLRHQVLKYIKIYEKVIQFSLPIKLITANKVLQKIIGNIPNISTSFFPGAICLIGPPGSGKTLISKKIAKDFGIGYIVNLEQMVKESNAIKILSKLSIICKEKNILLIIDQIGDLFCTKHFRNHLLVYFLTLISTNEFPIILCIDSKYLPKLDSAFYRRMKFISIYKKDKRKIMEYYLGYKKKELNRLSIKQIKQISQMKLGDSKLINNIAKANYKLPVGLYNKFKNKIKQPNS